MTIPTNELEALLEKAKTTKGGSEETNEIMFSLASVVLLDLRRVADAMEKISGAIEVATSYQDAAFIVVQGKDRR